MATTSSIFGETETRPGQEMPAAQKGQDRAMEAKQDNPSASPGKVCNISFDEHGDVILVLPSPDSTGTARFQVNSSVLCLASPVFRAMLGPDSAFKEAKALAAISTDPTRPPLELSLDDDPNAFAIILRIIHLQFDWVPTTRPIDEGILYKMAIACDKYDMKLALKYWFKKWTSVIGDSSLPLPVQKMQGPRWLFMAYAFAHETLFSELSLQLILQCHVNKAGQLYLPNVKNGKLDNFIPQPVKDAISAARQQTLEAFFDCVHRQLEQYISTTGSPVLKCHFQHESCDAMNLGLLILEFRRLNVYPEASAVHNRSVMEVKQHLEGLRFPSHITLNKAVGACCDAPEFRECHTGGSYCLQCVTCKSCGRRYKPAVSLCNHAPHCSPVPKFKEELQKIVDQVKGLDYSQYSRDKKHASTQVPPHTDLWNVVQYT
ncbi:hypothetical protein BDZ91DRAFT_748453 [Kalaharituber pfeilii]|nr:hypothetical protein BDZ91DRAFT_748453 [Kalaharituber pfeilii]